MKDIFVGLLALTILAACGSEREKRVENVRFGMSKTEVQAILGEPEGLNYGALPFYNEQKYGTSQLSRAPQDSEEMKRNWPELKRWSEIWFFRVTKLGFSRDSVEPNGLGIFEGQADLWVRFGFGSDGFTGVEEVVDWGGLTPTKMLVVDREVIRKRLDPFYKDFYK